MKRIVSTAVIVILMIGICAGALICLRAAAGETESDRAQEVSIPPEKGTEASEPGQKQQSGKDGADPGQKDVPSETGSGKEQPPETESDSIQPGDAHSTEPQTDEPQPVWSAEDLRNEPEGMWTVRVTDVRADLPEEGRYYDGTDRIRVLFHTSASSGTKEDPPAYRVLCDARLDSPDAGERKVIGSFLLQTPWPEHVKLDASTTEPDITVTVKKAVLQIRISDGTKRYGDPADLDHIEFRERTVVHVSGFAEDENGVPVIPEGFRAPEAVTDRKVLKKDSPIYGADPSDPDRWSVLPYRNAVVLKRDEEGHVTGDPTANYEFCTDPEDPRCHMGTVTVTSAPAVYGRDYTVTGPEGAFFIGEDGTAYVRSGCSLEVKASSGSDYNSGYTSGALEGEGSISFRLSRRDSRGRLLADSEDAQIFYRADAFAAPAVFTVSRADKKGDAYFANHPVSVSYRVPEDDVSGIRSVRIRFRRCGGEAGCPPLPEGDAAASEHAWSEAGMSGSAELSQEGIWRLEAEVTDRVGNSAASLGDAVVIDSRAPSIEIRGALNGSANAGRVRLTVSCSDPWYQTGSLQTQLSAAYGGTIPDTLEGWEDGQGALIRFADFPVKREADAAYTLRVTASDLAGNRAERTITFSVNRFGSAYRLSEDTRSALGTYYHQDPFPVTFIETNIDRVSNARILLREGQQLRELTSGAGMQVQESRTGRKTWRYRYTVPSEAFSGDGIYEVMLMSRDAAGNSADSTAQQLPVRFAVDRTPPECLVTGIRPGEIRREDDMTAVLEVRDNMAIACAGIYVNASLQAEYSAEQIAACGGVIKVPLRAEKDWQTLQIHVTDRAGNELWTEEVPFLLGEGADGPYDAQKGRRLSARQIQFIRSTLSQWKQRAGSLLQRMGGGEGTITFRSDRKPDSRDSRKGITGGMLRAERVRGLGIFTLLFILGAAALLLGKIVADCCRRAWRIRRRKPG